MTEHIINLYMHEVAMHVDHNVEEFKPPFTEEQLRGPSSLPNQDLLTPAHISALSTCLTSIDGVFDIFLSLPIPVIRSLPIFHFVRVAYAVVVLIKMFFAATTPNSELGKVIDKDNMKVEHYLDRMLETFRATAEDEKSRPAAKFLGVLVMLRTWFHRQHENKGPANQKLEVSAEPTLVRTQHETGGPTHSRPAPRPPAQHHEYSPANTPLQLLSEVATGTNPSSRPSSRAQYTSNNIDAPNPAAWAPSGAAYAESLSNHPVFGYTALDPAFGADLEYSMGDGFEQAMGMTLGDGEFGGYWGDETFFGGSQAPFGGGGDAQGVGFEGL